MTLQYYYDSHQAEVSVTEPTSIPTWETGMRQIKPNVYAYLQSEGTWFRSNAGLIVGKECAIAVDSLATPALTQDFIEEIKKVTDRPVAFVINTHHHGDHIWGNHMFKDAVVICHSRCWEMAQRAERYDPQVLNAAFPGFNFTRAEVTPPDLTFDRELTLYLDDLDVRIIHFRPGHTPGDTIVYLPREKVVFAGDLLFLYSTPVGMEATMRGWVDALDSMSELDADVFVPGHGPLCGSEGPHECREYLSLLRYEVRRRFDARLDVYEAARSINLGRFKEWANWERVVMNVDCLYREFRHDDPATQVDRWALLALARRLRDEDGIGTGSY